MSCSSFVHCIVDNNVNQQQTKSFLSSFECEHTTHSKPANKQHVRLRLSPKYLAILQHFVFSVSLVEGSQGDTEVSCCGVEDGVSKYRLWYLNRFRIEEEKAENEHQPIL